MDIVRRFGWRVGMFGVVKCGVAMVAVVAAATVGAQSAAPTIVEVHAGDTFAGIAARFTGSPATWRKLYQAQLSNLPNPNVISVGMRLELVSAAGRSQYLRLIPAHNVQAGAMSRLAPVPAASTAAPTPASVAAAIPPKLAPALSPALSPTLSPTLAPTLAPTQLQAPTQTSELVIGVLPNIAAAQLAPTYEHMRLYLERGGEAKVRIVIPANFKAFFDAAMKGDYDLAVAAPNLARVAQAERTMLPLVVYEPRINALFVTTVDSTITTPRDVRDRAIAFANPTSLVALYGQQWLRQQSLEAGKDYELKAARTDLGVGRMLLGGDAVAAIMSNGEFRSLPPEESARLKIFDIFARIPNFIVLAHPRLDRDRAARLKAQLKGFIADKEDGMAFGQATGISSMAEPDEAQLRELDAFIPATRRAMGYAN